MSGKSKTKWKTIPSNNESEISRFPFEDIKRIKKRMKMKSRLWEKPLPLPNPRRNSGLSIKSGNKAPMIIKILLLKIFFILGISEKIKGKATWNIRKI